MVVIVAVYVIFCVTDIMVTAFVKNLLLLAHNVYCIFHAFVSSCLWH